MKPFTKGKTIQIVLTTPVIRTINGIGHDWSSVGIVVVDWEGRTLFVPWTSILYVEQLTEEGK